MIPEISYQSVIDLIREQKNSEIENLKKRESLKFFNECLNHAFDEIKEMRKIKLYSSACEIANEIIEEILISLEQGSHLAA